MISIDNVIYKSTHHIHIQQNSTPLSQLQIQRKFLIAVDNRRFCGFQKIDARYLYISDLNMTKS